MDELTAAEFSNIRNAMDAADNRLRDHIEAQKESIAIALTAMNARLAGMNELRGVLSDVESTMAPRRELEALRDRVLEKLEQQRITAETALKASVDPLRSKIEEVTRPNWVLVTSCLSVLFVLITGAWLVTGLKIDQSMAPIALSLEQTKVGQAAIAERLRQAEAIQQERSSTVADVQNLKANYGSVIERLTTIRADASKVSAALVEIETQFCGQDNLRSQIHAQDLRTVAMLWKKVYGDEMPIANAFYARVGRCANGSNG